MSLPLVIRATTNLERRELDRGLTRMGEDEFRAFYERTARPLWAYLSRLTGDRQRADDLVQEAYYRFYRAGARHESEAHRRHSLFQIATNLARDEARRGRRRDEVPLDEEGNEGPPPASPSPLPERQAALRTDLSRALLRLEPTQREILWLAYAQGASHEEIATLVGVRAVSVRTMLLRARRKLATLLGGPAEQANAVREVRR
jgi:RNA polymerase sigma-70 factor (ECF subfamily)